MFETLNKSTVYGPVKSWRFGMSLGIDPIFTTSTCSFNCVYCQLGQIQDVTNTRREFVTTKRVLEDYKAVIREHGKIDVITFSGSGEPTLASNLGELIDGIKDISPKIPLYILTNGTLLQNKEVCRDLNRLDKVTVKLDAVTEKYFQLINRPVAGLTFEKLWKDILKFRSSYKGELEIQMMLMPMNQIDIEALADRLNELKPDLVQVNTPKRPYPLSWHRENRGNHEKVFNYPVSELKTISPEEAEALIQQLKILTGLNFQTFS